MTDEPALHGDFADLIRLLQDNGVEFLIVGAHALAAHGVVRSTGDLDVFVRTSPENARRVVAALASFGAPLRAHNINAVDFEQPNMVYQMGLPPRRIDILTTISGVEFSDAEVGAVDVEVGDLRFRVPSRASLLANKRASGRPKDLEDVRRLEASATPE